MEKSKVTLNPTLIKHGQNIQKLIVGCVVVGKSFDVLEKLPKILRQVFEQATMVERRLHQTHRVFVLDFTPRQRAIDHFDENVEQGPEVIVSTHLLILVGVD